MGSSLIERQEMNLLEIQSSARSESSITRALTQRIVTRLQETYDVKHRQRDLVEAVPFITETWIEQDEAAHVTSDALISELEWAEAVVIGLPIYNFSVPASFKAWFDQVAVPGRTFRYNNGWPEGLLHDRPTWVVVASDGVPVRSEVDFATPWLSTALNMLGINDLRLVVADKILLDANNVARAEKQIDSMQI